MSVRAACWGAARPLLAWFRRLAALLGAWTLLSAHVGTNQVVLEGQAGGYPVRVMIDPPGVVPAQVPILVRVLSGTPTRVTVRAAQWNVGTKGAPPAEDAARVAGEPGLWAHDLWIMTGSSYAVYVAVEGPAGNGSVLVPLQTSATRMLGMRRGLGVVLACLGTLLVAGFLTIIGAAVREGTLAPGAVPDAARQRGARVAMATAAALLALAVVGGAKWWNVEERAYQRRMLKPIAMTSAVEATTPGLQLTVAITDSLWRSDRLPPLLPDHGKLMHLVLARVSNGSADSVTVAHLHPIRVQADTFRSALPMLPAGRYLLFGDVLFQSGATRTLVDTVTVTTSAAGTATPDARATSPDTDDAWRTLTLTPAGQPAELAGGGTMTLSLDAPAVAKRDLRLSARVTDAGGAEALLDPYMGMAGHAFVLRADGSFFMHLHPMGTASMTAQAQLARRERGDTTSRDDSAAVASMPGMTHDTMSHDATGAVHFPFAFPAPGRYVVFVQVKRRGVIETAGFQVVVP